MFSSKDLTMVSSGFQLSELGTGDVEADTKRVQDFIAEIKTMPIAVNQANANEQHYEVTILYSYDSITAFWGYYIEYIGLYRTTQPNTVPQFGQPPQQRR